MRTPDQNKDPNLLDNVLNGFNVAECQTFDDTLSLLIYIPGMGQSILHGAIGMSIEPTATLLGDSDTYTVNVPENTHASSIKVEVDAYHTAVPQCGMSKAMHFARIRPNQKCAKNGSNAVVDGTIMLPIPINVHVTGDTSYLSTMTKITNPHDAILAMAAQEMQSIIPTFGPYTLIANDESGTSFTCTALPAEVNGFAVLGPRIHSNTIATLSTTEQGTVTLSIAVQNCTDGDTLVVTMFDQVDITTSIDANDAIEVALMQEAYRRFSAQTECCLPDSDNAASFRSTGTDMRVELEDIVDTNYETKNTDGETQKADSAGTIVNPAQAISLKLEPPLANGDPQLAYLFNSPCVFIETGSSGNRRFFYNPAFSAKILKGLKISGTTEPFHLAMSSWTTVVSDTAEIIPDINGIPRKISTTVAAEKLGMSLSVDRIAQHLFTPSVWNVDAFYTELTPIVDIYTRASQTPITLTITAVADTGTTTLTISTPAKCSDTWLGAALRGPSFADHTFIMDVSQTITDGKTTADLMLNTPIIAPIAVNTTQTMMVSELSLQTISLITPRAPVWSAGDMRIMSENGDGDLKQTMPFSHWYAWPLAVGTTSVTEQEGPALQYPGDLSLCVIPAVTDKDLMVNNIGMVEQGSQNAIHRFDCDALRLHTYLSDGHVFKTDDDNRYILSRYMGATPRVNLTDELAAFVLTTTFKSTATIATIEAEVQYTFAQLANLGTWYTYPQGPSDKTSITIQLNGTPFSVTKPFSSYFPDTGYDYTTRNQIKGSANVFAFFLTCIDAGVVYVTGTDTMVKVTGYTKTATALTLRFDGPMLAADLTFLIRISAYDYDRLVFFGFADVTDATRKLFMYVVNTSVAGATVVVPPFTALIFNDIIYPLADLTAVSGGAVQGSLMIKSYLLEQGTPTRGDFTITSMITLGSDGYMNTDRLSPCDAEACTAMAFDKTSTSLDGMVPLLQTCGSYAETLTSIATMLPYIATHRCEDITPAYRSLNGTRIASTIMTPFLRTRIGTGGIPMPTVLSDLDGLACDMQYDLQDDYDELMSCLDYKSITDADKVAAAYFDGRSLNYYQLDTGYVRSALTQTAGSCLIQKQGKATTLPFSDVKFLSFKGTVAATTAFDCIDNYATVSINNAGVISNILDGLVPQTGTAATDILIDLLTTCIKVVPSTTIRAMLDIDGFLLSNARLPESITECVPETEELAAANISSILRYLVIPNSTPHFEAIEPIVEQIEYYETTILKLMQDMIGELRPADGNSANVSSMLISDSTVREIMMDYAMLFHRLTSAILPYESSVDQNGRMLTYIQVPGIYTDLVGEDHEVAYILGNHQHKYGMWYYNLRKRYRLFSSCANLWYTIIMRLLSFMCCYNTMARPVIDKETVISPTSDFATMDTATMPEVRLYSFMKGTQRIYPVLDGGVLPLADMSPVRISHIDTYIPEEKLAYTISATLSNAIIDSTDPLYNILMPGIGSAAPVMTSAEEQTYWRTGVEPKCPAYAWGLAYAAQAKVADVLKYEHVFKDNGIIKYTVDGTEAGATAISVDDLANFVTMTAGTMTPNIQAFDTTRDPSNVIMLDSGRLFPYIRSVTVKRSSYINLSAPFASGRPRRLVSDPVALSELNDKNSKQAASDGILLDTDMNTKATFNKEIAAASSKLLAIIEEYGSAFYDQVKDKKYDCTVYGFADPQIGTSIQLESVFMLYTMAALDATANLTTCLPAIADTLTEFFNPSAKDLWYWDGTDDPTDTRDSAIEHLAKLNYNLNLSKRRAHATMRTLIRHMYLEKKGWFDLKGGAYKARILTSAPDRNDLNNLGLNKADGLVFCAPFKAYGFGAMFGYADKNDGEKYAPNRIVCMQSSTDFSGSVTTRSINIVRSPVTGGSFGNNVEFAMKDGVVKIPTQTVYFPSVDKTTGIISWPQGLSGSDGLKDHVNLCAYYRAHYEALLEVFHILFNTHFTTIDTLTKVSLPTLLSDPTKFIAYLQSDIYKTRVATVATAMGIFIGSSFGENVMWNYTDAVLDKCYIAVVPAGNVNNTSTAVTTYTQQVCLPV